MAESVARRAHGILKQLVAIDEPLRVAEAERLCGSDTALLERVRDLLGALSRTDGFLESPIGRSVRDAARAVDSPGLPTIQGFSIERLIGVGGMAAVYEATQELPRRRVALKVLRRSMAGTAALRRFEFETEVLAKLRHPGIAQIYEAGTFDDGAGAIPFFAMEFIDGARTLTDFCAERGLGMRERIELFVQVCDAVQHGHQNGVIHRDLKPGNVLVDTEGRPRVIDFGIARSSAEAASTGQTTVGQIIGTLNAMSPEQCAAHANVDARTDVYSLGILLYELLCRRAPHELSTLPVPEALRIIHDVAPQRPSAIDPSLRGDLEAIILKAIEKSPDRRYPTVAALGSDLRRYLRHESIEARSPTVLYQLRLFARRHRAFVAAAAVVVAALFVVTGVSVASAFRIKEELGARIAAEGKAKEERDTARWKTYIANIAGALASHSTGEGVQMTQLLTAAPEECRGWEWRWLKGVSNQSIAVAEAHRMNVMSMGVDEDNHSVTTVSRDGGSTTHSLHGLEPQSPATLFGEQLLSAAVLEHGRRIGVVTRDGRALVRLNEDGAQDTLLDRAYGECSWIVGLDAESVAVATRRGDLLRWTPSTGEVICRPEAGKGVDGLVSSADGTLLAAWNGGSVRLYDALTLEPRGGWDDEQDVGCVLLRPDLDQIFVGHAEGQVAIRSFSESRQTQRMVMRDRVSLVRSLALNHRGSQIAIGQGSGMITLVELPSTLNLGQFMGHQDAVIGLEFVDDDSRLVSGSWDRTVRLWDVKVSIVNSSALIGAHASRVMSVAFDRSLTPGRVTRLLSASSDKTARVTDVESYEDLVDITHHDAELFDAVFSPDGSLIATAGSDGRVCLSDGATGASVGELLGRGGGVWSLSFSPDGSLLAAAGEDGVVRVWGVAERTIRQTLVGHEERVIRVAFSHDGRRIASASRDGSVRIWALDAPERPRVLLGHGWDVFAVVWSLDDKELYTGSRDQTIRVWSTESCAELATIGNAHQFITSLALSPDGTRLIGGTWFGSVVFIDPRRRELVATVKVVVGTIRGVAFSADGHRIAVATGDGKVKLFDDRPAAERGMGERQQ